MFHAIHGQNVDIRPDRTGATWDPKQSGGCVFPTQSLGDEPITLAIEGSGGVEMGITTTDPSSLSGRVPVTCSKIAGYQFLNDVKIHKRSCSIKIVLDKKAKTVVSKYGSGQYVQHVRADRRYWLVADVKYGDLELKLVNNSENSFFEFSPVHGHNLLLLNDPTVVRTVVKNPGAICFLAAPLQNDQSIRIKCSSVTHQGTTPGRFFVKLRCVTIDPEELHKLHPGLFDTSTKRTEPSEWKEIETFEKEHCTGGIQISVERNMLSYWASLKRNQQPLNTEDGNVTWLVLELYGVTIKVESDQSYEEPVECSYDTNSQTLPSITVAGPVATATASAPHSPVVDNEPHIYEVIENSVSLESAIQKSWTKLLEQFIADDFIDCMFEDGVISVLEMERLEQSAKKVRQVLLLLSKKNVSKKFLIRALEKTKQSHLIGVFFPEYEKE